MTLFDYTPYYCEENVWRLCSHPALGGGERAVAFVSNPARAVALFNQRAARALGEPVLWDYHVVLLTRGVDGPLAWDLDTTLGLPVTLGAWLEGTFGVESEMPMVLRPLFRLVDAETYRERLSSDRSHMRRPDGNLSQPAPPWPPIGAAGTDGNLFRFVDMQQEFIGRVVDRAELEDLYEVRSSGAR
jgi:hypothetical protein